MAKSRLWLPKFCGSRKWEKIYDGNLCDGDYLEFSNHFRKDGIDFSITISLQNDWLHVVVCPVQNPYEKLTRCLVIENQSDLERVLMDLEIEFCARTSWKLTSDQSDFYSA